MLSGEEVLLNKTLDGGGIGSLEVSGGGEVRLVGA